MRIQPLCLFYFLFVTKVFCAYYRISGYYIAPPDNIFEAVQYEDLAAVEGFIREGVDLNQVNQDNMTALHLALKLKLYGISMALLRNGRIDISLKNLAGDTYLHFAAVADNLELFFLILNYPGLKIDEINDLGQTALHYAAQFGNESVLKVLINLNADISIKDYDGELAIDKAARANCQNCVTQLKEAEYRLNSYVLK